MESIEVYEKVSGGEEIFCFCEERWANFQENFSDCNNGFCFNNKGSITNRMWILLKVDMRTLCIKKM